MFRKYTGSTLPQIVNDYFGVAGKLVVCIFSFLSTLFSNVSMIKIWCNMVKKKLIEKLNPNNSEEFYSAVFTSCTLLILTPKQFFTCTTVVSFSWTQLHTQVKNTFLSFLQLAVVMGLGFQQWNVSRTDISNLCYSINALLFGLWPFPQARMQRGTE